MSRRSPEAPETTVVVEGVEMLVWSQAPNVPGYADAVFVMAPDDSGHLLLVAHRDGQAHVVRRLDVYGAPVEQPMPAPVAQPVSGFSTPRTPAPDFKRDRWGRPLVEQSDGTIAPYTRASSLSKYVADEGGLAGWKQRLTMLGLLDDPDVMARLRAANRDDRDELAAIAEAALTAAGGNRGAEIGTRIHAAVEDLLARGVTPASGSDLDDARAIVEEMNRLGLKALATELRVASHELRAAGTLDLLAQGPTRVLVVDYKTSGSADAAKYGALGWAVQLAAYATAEPYELGVGTVSWASRGLPEPNRDYALVLHARQGAAVVTAYSVDLRLALDAARIACAVRDTRAASKALLQAL